MTQLVNLLQYFGNYTETTKYSYLMEDPKVGDIVTDGSTYIGKVLSIKKVDKKYNYKTTYKMTKDLLERIEIINEIRRNAYIKEQIWEHEKDCSFDADIVARGWYIDPNYGFTQIIDDYDDDAECWSPDEPSKEELDNYTEFIFKKLIRKNLKKLLKEE